MSRADTHAGRAHTRTDPPSACRAPRYGDAVTDFASAYEAVLARWPEVEVTNLSSSYGTTRVLSAGPTDAPPVVLLPGGGATATVWFANVAALGAEFRVHALDLPGNPGYTAVSVRDAAELCAWLDEVLGIADAPVGLVGHSYGGWVALTYALSAPDRVRRLALLDPTQCFGGFAPAYLLHALPVLVRPSRRTAGALLRWETRGRALDPAWELVHGLAAEQPTTGKLVVRPRPTAARLRELRVPTLVLLAELSRAHDVVKVGAAARRLLPDVTTGLLPGATHHTLPMDPAVEVDSALLSFLRG
jgi:pimeloyl-ACP methyl ester carboxylesterase